MYEIFVSICRERLHVVISYNAGNELVAEMFRKHPVLIQNAVHIAVKVALSVIQSINLRVSNLFLHLFVGLA